MGRKTTGGVSVPVGYRFQPTEEELVSHYLKKKNEDKDFDVDHIIPVFDLCNYDPWDLPALLFKKTDSPHHDMEWFFYSPRDYKYINSTRSNRRTPGGHWKITGKKREIKAPRFKAVIGKKRTLTFYKGRVPNHKKTNWVMHEYDRTEIEVIPNSQLAQRDFVLCRLKNKSDKKDTSICAEGEPSSYNVSSCDDQAALEVTTEDYSSSTLPSPANTELGDVLQANGINDDCNDMQSPFGDNSYYVTEKNDISTCDKGEPRTFTVSDYENEAPDDMFQEQPQKDLDPLQLQVTQQSPTYSKLGDIMHIDVSDDGYLKCQSPFVDNYSCVKYKNNTLTYDDNELVSYTAFDFENQAADNMILEQSPIYTKLGSVPRTDVYNDECSKWQSSIWDNHSYLTDKNNISTNDVDEQFSYTTSNFENQTTDKRISKVHPQPEEDLEFLFH